MGIDYHVDTDAGDSAYFVERTQPQPSAPPQSPTTSADEQKADSDELDETDECVICMAEKKTQACIPCGHKQFCEKCVLKPEVASLRKCPECRADLEQARKFLRIWG